ncbi:ATP-binding cassette domain-containing protein [Pelagovum pacificum]|uniref:ATP-binding cassette domain-containing protein n=1 Tax=Pelagovum pacificum TaxID=2588711 RepID=A0A5C5GK23_9RHOB|nr:ATP-binding cassette domain-containing protein [Pelagovum pacificum]QQA43040.1 ATP-binding cassette domain-containing protein [Pelagovum pacificum]TNY33816.1 ATP-binding cassette domain-containing protein [Pelagovum pacificum]
MLTLEDITVTLGDFTLRADTSVPQGITAVIGPSGGGKSTLLSAIGGFAEVEGRIYVDGQDITGRQPAERPVATLFQDHNLFPHLTVAQNVGLGLVSKLTLPTGVREEVDEVLRRVGLSGMGDRKPGALSGGQQSRAALARALVQDKPVVLLDEPFAALGPALKAEMLDLARYVLAAPGRTLLMVTHDPGDAERVAEHVLLVMDGAVSGPHDRAALMADPPEALRTYLGGFE